MVQGRFESDERETAAVAAVAPRGASARDMGGTTRRVARDEVAAWIFVSRVTTRPVERCAMSSSVEVGSVIGRMDPVGVDPVRQID